MKNESTNTADKTPGTDGTWSLKSIVGAATPAFLAKEEKKIYNPVKDGRYYTNCAIGGALAGSISLTAITPIDIVKVNLQAKPGRYEGLIHGVKTLYKEGGIRSLFRGWQPQGVGYAFQGAGKFALYELFRDNIAAYVGEENALHYRGAIYLGAAAGAEAISDVVLCPLEMIKVKMQTSNKFPQELVPAVETMAEKKKINFPFGSLAPLWARQIPLTMAKFYFFERIVEGFYTHIFTSDKESYSKAFQLGITLTSGYAAGVLCAIVSHPADSLVSLKSTKKYSEKSLVYIAKEVGFTGLATSGLSARLQMLGTMTALQWWIYDTFKTAMGMGTTGGAKRNK